VSESAAIGREDRTGAVPEPEFAVIGARADESAAAPTVIFSLKVKEPTRHEIYTIALSAQILVDPAGRGYDEPAREALSDLFGPPEGMVGSLQSLVWARASVLAPSFTQEAIFELPVPCTYDLEVSSAKYFASLRDGVAPLDFHFNGTIFYRGDHDRLQLTQVPWSCTARYRMPVAVWRQAVAARFAETGWVRLHEETIERLRRRQAERGSPSLDALVAELLEEQA
jgi:Family of unknown function (DUF6084)